jgi:hypothetical protein
MQKVTVEKHIPISYGNWEKEFKTLSSITAKSQLPVASRNHFNKGQNKIFT